MRRLLLGLGNPILTDDAIGVRLVRDLRHLVDGLGDADVIEECAVGGLELVELLEGYDEVLAIDSIRTRDPFVGYWHVLGARDLDATRHLTGVHDCNVATALELGRRVGMTLPRPEGVTLIAVEIADGHTFGERLSPALERHYPRLVREVGAAVRDWLTKAGDSYQVSRLQLSRGQSDVRPPIVGLSLRPSVPSRR